MEIKLTNIKLQNDVDWGKMMIELHEFLDNCVEECTVEWAGMEGGNYEH